MFEYILSVITDMIHTTSAHIKCRIKSTCCFKATNVDVPTPKIIEIIHIFNDKNTFGKQTTI